MAFLYKSVLARGEHWKSVFAVREPNLPFRIWPDIGDPAEVRYMAAWIPPDDIDSAYPNLEVLFSTGAGVDQLNLSKVPPRVQVVRMLDPTIPDMMSEYVVTACLALRRDFLTFIQQQRAGIWEGAPPKATASRRVGVLGLGWLGSFTCQRLARVGFEAAGWSRSRHDLDGIATYAGEGELDAFLARTDILVCLLPLTPQTQGVLGKRLFEALPRGAALVHVGRGGHLDRQALLAALGSGHLSGAVLDTTDPEPLPPEDPLWRHPRILITPHIASAAQPETSVEVILSNLKLLRAGKPPVGLVDRGRGY